MATRVKRIMTQPINLIFRFLQSKTRVQIWIYEMKDLKIEGVIVVSKIGTHTRRKLARHLRACVSVFENRVRVMRALLRVGREISH